LPFEQLERVTTCHQRTACRVMHRRGYYEIFRGGSSIAHGEQQ
jgi:hypothetical protein